MPLNITLSPAQTELIAKPGTTLTQAYNITNNTASPQYLSTEVLPWQPDGSDGSVVYDQVPLNQYLNFSLANSDLRLGQSFVLKPNETRQLVLKIKSNSSIPQSDAYLTFFVVQNPGVIQSNLSGTATSARLGSHILLSYSSVADPKQELDIVKWTASPRLVDTFFPQIRLDGVVHNSGDFYTKSIGKITLTKGNQTLEAADIFPHNVLSGTDRNISCLKDNLPIPCTLHPPYWPGMYSASVSLNGTSASVTFFAFPFSLLLLISILAGLYFFSRRRPKTR